MPKPVGAQLAYFAGSYTGALCGKTVMGWGGRMPTRRRRSQYGGATPAASFLPLPGGGGVLALAEADEVLAAADEELAFAEGGGGEDFFAEVAFGEEVVRGAGLDAAEVAEVVDEIDVAFGAGEGGVVFFEPFFPGDLASFGGEAVADAGVADAEEPAVFTDGGGDVGDAFVGAPGDVGLGDVAEAVWADGQDVVFWEAAGHEEEVGFFVVNEGGDELFGGAVDDPDEAACAGIITGDAFAAGEDHLWAVGELADEGDAVAAGLVRPLDAPEFVAIGARKGDDVAGAVVVAIDDDFVFKEDGAGAEAVLAGEGAGADLPEGFAAGVMGADDDFGLV